MKYSLNELKRINNRKIKEYKEESNENELEIQLTIKDILEKENCFFNIDSATAIDLLTKLIEKDSIKETYIELINGDNFKKKTI